MWDYAYRMGKDYYFFFGHLHYGFGAPQNPPTRISHPWIWVRGSATNVTGGAREWQNVDSEPRVGGGGIQPKDKNKPPKF